VVHGRDPALPTLLSNPFNIVKNPITELNLAGLRDIAFDAVRNLLYASISSASPSNANQVLEFNPVTHTIVGSLPINGVLAENNWAGKLAVADDGSQLYISTDFGERIQRLDLATRQVAAETDLGNNGSGEVYLTWDLEVSPAGQGCSRLPAVSAATGAHSR
jgi:hypothetical protein